MRHTSRGVRCASLEVRQKERDTKILSGFIFAAKGKKLFSVSQETALDSRRDEFCFGHDEHRKCTAAQEKQEVSPYHAAAKRD